MHAVGPDDLLAQLSTVRLARWGGRISEIGRGTVRVTGLSNIASLGDIVRFERAEGELLGEILHIDDQAATIMPEGHGHGLVLNGRVLLLGRNEIAPSDNWIGRVVDPYGNAIGGEPVLRGPEPRPLKTHAPNPTERRALGTRLETGLTVFNTFLPIVRGQRIGLFAGSGVGKSTLIGKLATGIEADVIVFAMIGERGREVREFVEKILGPMGMRRSVVVAATSDQSPLTRRRCAYAAMATAEFFRDQGRQVLLIADSVTRFAEAHREVALAAGEPASLRGHPPSMAHEITALCERAGPGTAVSGDITAIFSVLVAASDMEEPVADTLRGVLDGHVVLDRKIAERGRFPSIDVLRSVSRSLPGAALAEENAVLARARALLGAYEENELMIRAGLYSAGSSADIDAAIEAWPKLDNFVTLRETDGVPASFEKLEACLQSEQQDGA